MSKLNKWYLLTPQDLVNLAQKDAEQALAIMENEALVRKLGCHKNNSKLFGSSYFWKSFNPKLDKDDLLASGFYLFEFLRTHTPVYEVAKHINVLDHLSNYQRMALENYHYKKDDHQFYKRNVL